MRFAAIAIFLVFGYSSEIELQVLSFDADPLTIPAKAPLSRDRELEKHFGNFLEAFHARDYDKTGYYFSLFDSLISGDLIEDKVDLSDACYYCGLHKYVRFEYKEAIFYFNKSFDLRNELGMRDSRYRRALRNFGNSLFNEGRYIETIILFDSLTRITSEIYGAQAVENIDHYNNLAGAYNQINEYDLAIEAASKGLEIFSLTGEGDPFDLGMLNQNIAISYARMNDYRTSVIYLDYAYNLLSGASPSNMDILVNLMNSLAINHSKSGNRQMAEEWYLKALPYAVESVDDMAFLLISNYAAFLAEEDRMNEARYLLFDAIKRAEAAYSGDSRVYVEVITRLVSVLSRFKIDNPKAILVFEDQLIPYCLSNRGDSSLFRDIHHSYAMALYREGDHQSALSAIQRSLFQSAGPDIPEFEDPPVENFTPDRIGLGILADKVQILRAIYRESADTAVLAKAISSNRNLISSIETVRISLREEESRMLLGDNYRRIYEETLVDIYKLFTISKSEEHFRLAFEYAERSKAAGLLASLRSVRAARFLIPDSLASKEKEADTQLGAIRERIVSEKASASPDEERLKELSDREYELVSEKNALTKYFETNYPEYYAARYNTSVSGIDDVRKKLGRRTSYINYILTDSQLFIFVVNRKSQFVNAVPVSGAFMETIAGYRKLLGNPANNGDQREQLREYCRTGHALYRLLLEPVISHINSSRLIVSPDGMLAYIPFETLLRSDRERDDLLYRELDYLIFDYDISYTYSATMLNETSGGRRSFSNRGVFFAPQYFEGILPDSVLHARQMRQDTLFDLPHARDEVRFAHQLTGGELYLGDDARESAYKARASEFSIVHLAMHTLINNDAPALSRLIFSSANDGEEDGLLNTYEIYGVPLSAGMVMVSSCNTGYGKLRAGEGMMSLARGFVSAGAKSVVMSLWEVDDKWGSETVKSFYSNLRSGMTKSGALRKAKLDIILGSYQFQSHPYYWSTLMLYGNREAIYFDKMVIISLVLLTAVILAAAARIIVKIYPK